MGFHGTVARNPTQWTAESPDTLAPSSQTCLSSTKSIYKSDKVSNIAGPPTMRHLKGKMSHIKVIKQERSVVVAVFIPK